MTSPASAASLVDPALQRLQDKRRALGTELNNLHLARKRNEQAIKNVEQGITRVDAELAMSAGAGRLSAAAA